MNKNDNVNKNVMNKNVINDTIINDNVINKNVINDNANNDNSNNDFEFDFSMCHGTYCFYRRYNSFYES